MSIMKHLRIYSLVVLAIMAFITSCEDEDIVLVPEWETGVHGLASFAPGSPTNFVFQDATTSLDINLKWVSIDSKNSVTKIDMYVMFDEPFVDKDGNPVVANHAIQEDGTNGVLFTSFSGSAVPANRVNTKVTLTQPALYNLFKDATYDYDGDDSTAPTPVFNNPDVPTRSAANPFVKGDAFTVRWEFTTEDGRKFNKWGVSVCTEFPGANCLVSWGVICASDLAGTYDVVSTFDSPGYFTSAAPDFQYGPGNDGSVHDGVQTHDGVAVVVDPDGAAATYLIDDITNGFEPIMWGNPKVKALVSDQCGNLVMAKLLWGGYAYSILPGSVVNPDGSLTIRWINTYGENGVSTFTPQ